MGPQARAQAQGDTAGQRKEREKKRERKEGEHVSFLPSLVGKIVRQVKTKRTVIGTFISFLASGCCHEPQV